MTVAWVLLLATRLYAFPASFYATEDMCIVAKESMTKSMSETPVPIIASGCFLIGPGGYPPSQPKSK